MNFTEEDRLKFEEGMVETFSTLMKNPIIANAFKQSPPDSDKTYTPFNAGDYVTPKHDSVLVATHVGAPEYYSDVFAYYTGPALEIEQVVRSPSADYLIFAHLAGFFASDCFRRASSSDEPAFIPWNPEAM